MSILSTWKNDEVSEAPCARCGGEVIEFTIPNDIWNKVIRVEGRERDDEYLCIDCFFAALRKAINLP
jgi:hypothetical protein